MDNVEGELIVFGGIVGFLYLAAQAAKAGQSIPTYVREGIQQAGTTPLDPYTPDAVLCQWFPSWCGIKDTGTGTGTNVGTTSGTTTGTADTGGSGTWSGCYPDTFVGPLPEGARYCTALENLGQGIVNLITGKTATY